jgi:hypothetical protein
MKRLLVTLTLLLLALPAAAQQRVDCGNGRFCPAGNACLMDGNCALIVQVPPGAVRMADGNYCDPGWREGFINKGRCIPPGYIECPQGGGMCPSDQTCDGSGACVGGPPPSGPMCGNVQCAAGRICSSSGRCMNTAILHDCGNGSICPHSAACEYPRGCVYVSGGRTPQR